ncbi:MAG: hypothetical protein WA419_07505 [Silvibacterium sp.]
MADFAFICVVRVRLLHRIEVSFAPETETNDRRGILIMQYATFGVAFTGKQIVRIQYAHLPQLLAAMFRAGQKLDRTLGMVTVRGREEIRASNPSCD